MSKPKPAYLYNPASGRVLEAAALRPATDTEIALAGFVTDPPKTASTSKSKPDAKPDSPAAT